MTKAKIFVEEALKLGFNLWSGVPSSNLHPFVVHVVENPQIRYISAVNEGDAVSIASGNKLAGNRGIAIFQNLGLGNAVVPLTSMNYIFKIPILLIITLRGEQGGFYDEPQLNFISEITTKMLDTMKIKWEYFPSEETEVTSALKRSVDYMEDKNLPFAFIVKKESFQYEKRKLKLSQVSMPWVKARTSEVPKPQFLRLEMLRAVHSHCTPYDIVIGTSGFTGIELYSLGHRANQFYMIGAMGFVSSLSLGVSIARPNLRIIALDGDGSLLMRMGVLATIGNKKPSNMVHIVLDNSLHESTSGQATVASAIDFCAVAAACGYEHIYDITRPSELEAILSRPRNAGLTFTRARILPGYSKNLPKNPEKPQKLAEQFSDFIRHS